MRTVGMLLLTTIGGLWACSSGPPVGSLEQPLCNCDVEDPPCCCTSPILIDVAGDGFRLTSWTDGVEFAPHPGFRPSARAWTEPNSDDAWLVLDREGDGVINDGSEMFGNATPQPQPAAGRLRNGFLALAQYDDDGSRTIDERDAIFSELRLWQDADHDGVSQPWEMHALLELGVAGISLDYAEAKEVDQHGNSFRYKAAVYGTPGSPVGMTAWDVWLVGAVPEPRPALTSRAAMDETASAGCGGDETGSPPIPPRMDCTGLGVRECQDCCYFNFRYVDGERCNRMRRDSPARRMCQEQAGLVNAECNAMCLRRTAITE